MLRAVEQIGRYRVLGELGRGGAGVVLRAQGPRGEAAAIKLLLAGREASEHARRRFAREAEALARLDHPNLVAVREVGEHEGCPYLVMDYVAGEDLESVLRQRGRLAPAEAVAIARGLAAALGHAHARGVVHRDVKPANVLLEASGRARLTDFGLAKDLDPARSRLSVTGVFLGTPGYWPPEQAQGQKLALELTPAADVYTLGGTLYHLLGGAPPHGAISISDLLQRGYQPPRPLRQLAPGLDPELLGIVARCLAEEPSERYPDMAALDAALASWSEGQGARRGGGAGTGPASGARLAAALAAAALVAAALLTGALVTGALGTGTLGTGALGTGALVESGGGLSAATPSRAAGQLGSAPPSAGPRATPRDELAWAGDEAQTEPPPAGADEPPRSQRLLALAEEQMARAGVAAALSLLERASALRPLDPSPHLLRAYYLGEEGRLEEARAALERATERAAGQAWVWWACANTLCGWGALEEALAAIERATRIAPAQPMYLATQGNVLARLGRRGRALLFYQRALERDPEHSLALISRGLVRINAGRFAEGLADARRAARRAPDDPDVRALLGFALARSGLDSEAIEVLSLAIERRPTPFVYYSRALALHALGRREEAVADLRAGLKATLRGSQDLEVGAIQKRLVRVLRQLGRYAEALEVHEQLVALGVESLKDRTGRAISLLKLGHLLEAERVARAVLEPGSRRSGAWVTLARILAAQGRHAEAISTFERTLELEPSWHDVELELCESLLAKGELARAERRLMSCLERRESQPARALLARVRAAQAARRGE